MLSRPTVIRLATILQREDGAFLVGGQALNFWAERYWETPGLAEYGPFTSKDIDYFGRISAAEKLAKVLNGNLKYPDADDSSPSMAVVEAKVDGQKLEIDFLRHVLGVEPNSLERLAVDIAVPLGADAGRIMIPIMHPVHCFQSRITNAYRLDRTKGIAARQLQAAPIVVRAYLLEMLGAGHLKEVFASVRELFAYLRSDTNGRKAHRILSLDPLKIFEELAADQRLDSRYREKTLGPMIERLARIRSRRWPSILEGLFIEEPAEPNNAAAHEG